MSFVAILRREMANTILNLFLKSWGTKLSYGFRAVKKIRAADGSLGDLSDEDDDLCPVECVREFYTDDELFKILDATKENHSLVVVDFYRTSCGSCKYIEQGFSKLCKKAGDGEAEVIFLKHNVIDEYENNPRLQIGLELRWCLSSISIKMVCSWKHSEPETRSGSLQQFVNTHLLQHLNFFELIYSYICIYMRCLIGAFCII